MQYQSQPSGVTKSWHPPLREEAAHPAVNASAPGIIIREDRCKGCGLCVEACPRKILEFAPGFNNKGYHPVRCVDQERCIGCAMCGRTCPDMVIEVYK